MMNRTAMQSNVPTTSNAPSTSTRRFGVRSGLRAGWLIEINVGRVALRLGGQEGEE